MFQILMPVRLLQVPCGTDSQMQFTEAKIFIYLALILYFQYRLGAAEITYEFLCLI